MARLPEVPPKFVSPTSPAARSTAVAGGLAYYACSDDYLPDVEHAVIVDVEATTAVRSAEASAARTMLTRTAETFGIWPERLTADTGYGLAAMLGWLVEEQGIEPHIPAFDNSQRMDGTFSRFDFTDDHGRDQSPFVIGDIRRTRPAGIYALQPDRCPAKGS